MSADPDCIFCKIVAGKIPCIKIYEDERTLAFMDIMPLNPGHLLVVPKDHYGTMLDIDPELYGHLSSVICQLARGVQAAVNPDGMNVQQLNGKAANQVVPHVHLHLVPRFYGDGVPISNWESVQGDLDEISAMAEKIKAAL